MGSYQEEKSKQFVNNEKAEVIDILDEKLGKESKQLAGSDSSFTTSSHSENHDIEGYVSDLQWTEAEERKVLTIIDTRLMPYVLLMTFVLNMDRTNICKNQF